MISQPYRAGDALRRRAFGQDTGRTGEDLAHRYLRFRGARSVAQNYRTRSDIVSVALDRPPAIEWIRNAFR